MAEREEEELGEKGGNLEELVLKEEHYSPPGGGAIEELGDSITGIVRLEMLALTGATILGGILPTDADIKALKEAYAEVKTAYKRDYVEKYATLHDKVVDMLKKLEEWKDTATRTGAAIKLNPIIKNLQNAKEAMRASQCLGEF